MDCSPKFCDAAEPVPSAEFSLALCPQSTECPSLWPARLPLLTFSLLHHLSCEMRQTQQPIRPAPGLAAAPVRSWTRYGFGTGSGSRSAHGLTMQTDSCIGCCPGRGNGPRSVPGLVTATATATVTAFGFGFGFGLIKTSANAI